MHGVERGAQVQTDARDGQRIERAFRAKLVLERRAVDEAHPHADLAVDPLGAVDRHHIRMADASQQARFFDDGGGFGGLLAPQDLQRDRPIEPRVVCPIDVAERASTDVLEDGQGAPLRRQDIERRARDTLGRVSRWRRVNARYVLQDTQLVD